MIRNKRGNDFMSGFANDNYLSEIGTSNPTHPSPTTSVAENDKAYLLEIGLPEFTKEEINVELQNLRLIITGRRELPKNQGEIRPTNGADHNNFQRAFFIAKHIDESSISAKFENGMLIITLPKLYEPEGESSVIEID